jgi:hypothetical protein
MHVPYLHMYSMPISFHYLVLKKIKVTVICRSFDIYLVAEKYW